MCVPLTFLHHARCHSELGGVVGGSVTFGLPGFLLSHDELLPVLDRHVRLRALAVHLSLCRSLRKNKNISLFLCSSLMTAIKVINPVSLSGMVLDKQH